MELQADKLLYKAGDIITKEYIFIRYLDNGNMEVCLKESLEEIAQGTER